MTEAEKLPLDDEVYIEVFRNAHSPLLHIPDPDEDLPTTLCNIRALLMIKERRPASHAGVWCTECLREASQNTLLFNQVEPEESA